MTDATDGQWICRLDCHISDPSGWEDDDDDDDDEEEEDDDEFHDQEEEHDDDEEEHDDEEEEEDLSFPLFQQMNDCSMQPGSFHWLSGKVILQLFHWRKDKFTII